jgi:NADP-dependent 3-hydroxy acid dehydrogenase YdfG
VIVSARSEIRLQDLASELGNATVLPMDVTDAISVESAAQTVGPIDGVIYNAGHMSLCTPKNGTAKQRLRCLM